MFHESKLNLDSCPFRIFDRWKIFNGLKILLISDETSSGVASLGVSENSGEAWDMEDKTDEIEDAITTSSSQDNPSISSFDFDSTQQNTLNEGISTSLNEGITTSLNLDDLIDDTDYSHIEEKNRVFF